MMRTRTLVAVVVAGAATLGGATTLALGADDPKPAKERRASAIRDLRPGPAPFVVRGGFLPDGVGIDQALGEELAKELGIEEEKVDAALRKVIESRLNAHRDRVLACFDDPGRCAGIPRAEIALPEAMPGFPLVVPPRLRTP